MDINFILPHVQISGGVRVVFEYANRLSERGHTVTIFYPTLSYNYAKNKYISRSGILRLWGGLSRVLDDSPVDWFDLNVDVQQVPTLSTGLIDYVERSISDADVTIATSWETSYTVAALSDSKGQKVYFVQHYEIWDTWNSHEAWEQVRSIADDPVKYPIEMQEVEPPNKKARYEKELVDDSYELPLSKITITSWLEELLKSKFEQEVAAVVHNSVNHNIFYPDGSDSAERLSILLPMRDKPWKGKREVENLIEDIGTSYDVRINTYGSEPESENYPCRVSHHPDVSDSGLRELYSKSDIFVLPSWVEGFGLPILEAMACECAVVSTEVGIAKEIPEDSDAIQVVPPRNYATLVDSVRQLLENKQRRNVLKENGRKAAIDSNWDNATERFEQALQETV